MFVIIAVGLVTWNSYQTSRVNSYADCVAAGYPVLDSYPEQCQTPDGRTFRNTLPVGAEVTYTGKLVCLPHKNTSGPVTLECAYGLQTANGDYHGLKNAEQLFEYNVNDEIMVQGKIAEANNSIYNIVDTVDVTSITAAP